MQRHWYMSPPLGWPLWRHNDRLFPSGFYGRFLITMVLNSVISGVCKLYACAKFLKFHYRNNLRSRELFDKLCNIWLSKGNAHGANNDLIMVQRQGCMRTTHGFGTELIRNPAIWLAQSRNYYLFIQTFGKRTLHGCPSQMNESLMISNNKLTRDSELIW